MKEDERARKKQIEYRYMLGCFRAPACWQQPKHTSGTDWIGRMEKDTHQMQRV